MGVIDLNKYLTDIPEYTTGRLRYNPFNMLKTVLFGFMTSGYCSLREPEDNCKVNIRFMYLMDHHTPSYRTFGYFINEVLQDKIENIFNDINQAIFNEEHVDLQHIYIDGSKFEANAKNIYRSCWREPLSSDMDCFIPLMKHFKQTYGIPTALYGNSLNGTSGGTHTG